MEILTADQVADRLQISRRMVDKMVEKGELPCFKLGCRVRFILEDLIAWARAQYSKQSKAAIEGLIPCPASEPEQQSSGSQFAEYARLLGLPYKRTRPRLNQD